MTQRYPGFEDQGGTRPMGYQPQGAWRSHEGDERWRSTGRHEPHHENQFGASCPTCGASTASWDGRAGAGWREPNEGASFATPPRGDWGSPQPNWGPPHRGRSQAGNPGMGTGFYGPNPYANPGVPPEMIHGAQDEPGNWSGSAGRTWNSPSTPGPYGGWRSERSDFARPSSSWSPSIYGGPQGESSWAGGTSRTGRGPKGYKRSDDRIREDISDRLLQGNVDASEVTVSVNQGEVTLEGSVSDRSTKRRIEDLAESVLGASQVNNHLRIEASSDESGSRNQGRDRESGSQRDRDTDGGSRDRSRSAGSQPSSRTHV